MFAVFESGGKQHRVSEGDVIRIERLSGEPGQSVEFERVLLVSEGDGVAVAVGAPYVEGGKVTAEVVEQGRADKVRVIKFKRRKNYLRRAGHRQQYTAVRITGINGSGG